MKQPEPASPQGQYGTQRVEPDNPELKEDRIPVGEDQLPPAMLDELDTNDTYAGWEQGNIFFDKDTDQYIVQIVRENTTHTFRFDKEGTAIRTDAPIDSHGDQQ